MRTFSLSGIFLVGIGNWNPEPEDVTHERFMTHLWGNIDSAQPSLCRCAGPGVKVDQRGVPLGMPPSADDDPPMTSEELEEVQRYLLTLPTDVV